VDADANVSLEQLPYLLRQKSVRYVPSASLLLWFAEHGRKQGTWQKEMLLLGDAVYGDEEPASAPVAAYALERSGQQGFARLLKTRDEVTAIAASRVRNRDDAILTELRHLPRSRPVSGSQFDLLLGADANEAALKRDLSQYRILHIAAHGHFDPDYPWFSGLVLSGDANNAGFLNLVEIATLNLDAEIVFLSACQTAAGNVMQGEGIKSTARSFLLAGARSVVATQWPVMDEAAPIVATTFYQRLFDGLPPAEALRQAKITLLEERGDPQSADARGARPFASAPSQSPFAHPAFWAPFVLWGG
jgi:CHAT domain-containing protein